MKALLGREAQSVSAVHGGVETGDLFHGGPIISTAKPRGKTNQPWLV